MCLCKCVLSYMELTYNSRGLEILHRILQLAYLWVLMSKPHLLMGQVVSALRDGETDGEKERKRKS